MTAMGSEVFIVGIKYRVYDLYYKISDLTSIIHVKYTDNTGHVWFSLLYGV